MKRYDLPTEIIEVTVDQLNSNGQGVAFYTHAPDRGSMGKRLTLFIHNTVPGDVVRVTVPNAKGRRRARIDEFELLKPSPDRNLENPIKETIAGGTPLQYMKYDAQLKYKENLVKSYLTEENFDISLVQPIIGLEEPNNYRNKMEFTFGPDGSIGMHEQGNFKNIIDLEDSIIAPKIMIEIKKVVSKWQKEHQLTGYDKEAKIGLLRQLMIRKSFATDEIMVVIVATKASESLESATKDLILRLTKHFHEIKSLLWIESDNQGDQFVADKVTLLAGRDYIHERLNGFDYHLYYDTFFQANSKQAENMVSHAMEMADVNEEMRVLDLFCGIGTFSLPFAQKVKELVGIELVEQSILSAKENAKKAGLKNTHFFASDARKGLEKLKETWVTPDLLILNPPRSGAGGKLMRAIGEYGSQNIIYISCNPKTLADDLKWLRAYGYEFKQAQPIDQFPHTVHVETIVLLSHKNPQTSPPSL